MRRSTLPVSAFFLLDSPAAISKCKHELSRLAAYGMQVDLLPRYFARIREVYDSRQDVLNFDQDVPLHCGGRDFQALLRCHALGDGRYELELWLPGVIANAASAMFKDGREGFFCAFMPPSFYD